ncbi:MAG: hypothetical protein Q7R81_03155 [Candidatus Peregrinibacteria bacterium]|nr:hypothetical protein [Candidatus Peregrinibacteria bacterium]
MKHNVKDILRDLYEIDPTLREQENELVPLIELLLKNDPSREPDSRFVHELRARLAERAEELSSERESPSPFFSLFSMNRFAYALSGAVVASLVLIPALTLYKRGPVPAETQTGSPLFSFSVTDAGDAAFGDLTNTTTDNPEFGRGGGGVAAPEAVPQATDAAALSMDSKMIAPDYMEYEYVYEGEIPALPEGTVDIYKREKRPLNVALSGIADRFHLGAIDLSAFKNATVDMLNFVQDRSFGYVVSVMLNEGSVSISQNWQKWPHPEQECTTDACFLRYRLKPEDVPADDVLIAIANDFVEEYGIDLTSYGAPEVDTSWKRDYDRAPTPIDAYIPESQRVIYPLLIDGKPVYEKNGVKAGISVGVHAREKRVSDVWGLMDQRYAKSAYAAADTPQAVKDFLARFEKLTYELPEGGKKRTVKVTLGTPTIGFAKYYRFDGGNSEELVVPSLLFPVTGVPEGEYVYRQTIAVPLAKDLLENPPVDMPIPYMMEKAVE